MNTSNESNGCQPPLPGHPPQSHENSAGSSGVISNEQDICRNYVWGTCFKKKQCRFRHSLNFSEMKTILRFCHDYQNPSGCNRESCTYLHATKEEERLFLSNGTIPRVLADRHSTMNMPPPPPPPPPQQVPMQTHVFVAMNPVVSKVNSILPVTQLPPPPPPPNPPEQNTPVYTAPPPPQGAFNLPLPIFDVSKPPPPIPGEKRQYNGDVAGANKKRRPEDQNAANVECVQCLQRELRMVKYQDEIERLSTAEEYEVMLYKKRLEEFQAKKELWRLLMEDLEDCVETTPHSMRLEDLMPTPTLTPTPTPTPTPARRPDPNNSINIQKLLEFLKSNQSSPESSLGPDNLTSSTVPQITNVQKLDGAQAITPGTGSYAAVVAPFNNHTNPASAMVSVPARAHAAPANVNYPTYNQAMPPPSPVTTYYGSQYVYPCTSASMAGYGSVRADMSASQGPTTQPVSGYKSFEPYTSGRHNHNNYPSY